MPVEDNPVTRVVITADNYKNLSSIVLSLKEKGVRAICLAPVALGTLSSESHDLLVPTTEMLPYLLSAIKLARKEGLSYQLADLPLCILPGEEDHFIKGSAPGIKMQFCLACELSPRCGGITKAQLIAEYGTQLLSWQFLFPMDFFTQEDIAFLDDQLLKEANKA